MTAFWIAFFFVCVAEMGDKTQFMTLSFSTRYSWKTVIAAVFVATLLIHLVSVAAGEALGMAMPLFWIDLLAGMVFIGFGLWTLRGAEEVDEKAPADSRLGPFLTIGTTFFLAELGDRTMLATMMIAGRQRSFIGVWLGATAGMVLANGLAIIVGKILGRRLPERLLNYGTAIIFIASGLVALAEAFRHR